MHSLVWLYVTPWTIQPGSSVHGIPRQEYWSGLLFPSPGDLPEPGVEPGSPALAGGFFTTAPMYETWETQVQSLGWDDLLEEEMSIHSSILAWRILWTEEPAGLQSMGSKWVEYNWGNLAHTYPGLCGSFLIGHWGKNSLHFVYYPKLSHTFIFSI